MRWPWKRREAAPEAGGPSPDAREAILARCRAELELEQARQKEQEVAELAETLRRHRRVNHFAELFIKSMEEGR